jgi:hypothetical protein
LCPVLERPAQPPGLEVFFTYFGFQKEKGGIREEVDAAVYSGSAQGGGENRSRLKDSGDAAVAQ